MPILHRSVGSRLAPPRQVAPGRSARRRAPDRGLAAGSGRVAPSLAPARARSSVALLALLGLLLPLLVLPGLPGAARAAEDPGAVGFELQLSWGSPLGLAGARDTLVRACGDTARVDTLYLSFVSFRDLPTLYALTGEVELSAADGDTLLGYWSFESESRRPGGCRGEFAATSQSGCPFPWSSSGMLGTRFRREGGKAVVRLQYIVSARTPASIRGGERYCFARVLIRHRADGPPGCDQPLRLEWNRAEFTVGPDPLWAAAPSRPVHLLAP